MKSTRDRVIQAEAPGSLMLFGEHAVLHGYPALAAAIDRNIRVWLQPRTDDRIRVTSALGSYEAQRGAIGDDARFRFLVASLRTYETAMPTGCDLAIESEFSTELGLGSSAAVTVATLGALDAWCGTHLDQAALHARALAVIRAVQGRGSGADAAASLVGGIVRIAGDPPTITPLPGRPPLAVVYSGAKLATAEVIARVETFRQRCPSVVDAIFAAMGRLSDAAAAALSEGADPARLGPLANLGEGLMAALGLENPAIREILDMLNLDPGLHGAKLSGSGLGDCVIAFGHATTGTAPYAAVPVRISERGLTVTALEGSVRPSPAPHADAQPDQSASPKAGFARNRTSNIEHRTPNIEARSSSSMLDVGRSMFDVQTCDANTAHLDTDQSGQRAPRSTLATSKHAHETRAGCPCHTGSATDRRRAVIRQLIDTCRMAQPVGAGEAYAPANIALVKYWGKRDTELNLPVTGSLSLSLSGQRGSHVRLRLCEGPDRVRLNGEPMPADTPFSRRLSAYLDYFRPGPDAGYAVEAVNTIPTAAGFASSASGFAALVKALDDLWGWRLEPRELSILARLGSGSACRSLYEGLVEWHAGCSPDGMDSYAEPLADQWPELRIGLMIVNDAAKPVGSREAMRRTVETSPLYRSWPDTVARDMDTIKTAIRTRDVDAVGRIAEGNALAMHATMLAARPAICYWQTDTLDAITRVQRAREDGLRVYFTMDAGPNLKLLYLADDAAAVAGVFSLA